MKRPRVEILYFDGCPNDVADPETAEAYRFLGSPTVRIDGRDVEPGAAKRSDFVFSCRVYRTTRGVSGEPDSVWIREALREAAA